MHCSISAASFFLLAIILIGVPHGDGDASARIVCDGNYQIIRGAPHATPYCQDNYLAEVARSYGMRVSAREIRSNPNVKARVCHFIGHDMRVRETCVNYRDDQRSPGLRF